MTDTLTVTATIKAPSAQVWQAFNDPQAIQQWNQASPDWHCPASENDLRIGGRFKHTMAARDGSFSFDFSGIYTRVDTEKHLAYSMDDGRTAVVHFIQTTPDTTRIVTEFQAENEHSLEEQQQGWQAILDSFKNYVEHSGEQKTDAHLNRNDIKNFITKFNEGFARNDLNFLVDQITDNMVWKMPGSPDTIGKAGFRNMMADMENHEPATLLINSILVDGNQAVADGTMTTRKDGKEETWAFCDIYTLSHQGGLKISAMHCYVVQVNTPQ
ncbi:SRPBCC domain-containing protein [Cellvibrio polysaccharolyticus]|nr:SRPBCC domain-containing protein [Cellvibrio polysaccharolyticus]